MNNSPEISRLLQEQFNMDAPQYRFIDQHNRNINLIANTDDKSVFVKVQTGETQVNCQFEIDVLKILEHSKNTLHFPTVLHNEAYDIQGSPAIVYEFLEGKPLEKSDVTQDILTRVAHGIAQMHDILKGTIDICPKTRFMPNDLSFISEFGWTDPITSDAGAKLLQLLPRIEFEEETKTVIHDDISMENVILSPEGLAIIDFSDAHISYRASDIGNTVKELIVDNFGYDTQLVDAFLDNYSKASKTPLSENEMASMPYLVLRRAVFLYCYYNASSSRDAFASKIEQQATTIRRMMENIQ